jgi:hypothetical protein
MLPHSQTSQHPVRHTVIKAVGGLFAVIGLAVVAYFLVVGALVIGIVVLAIVGFGALIAYPLKRRGARNAEAHPIRNDTK